jgi:hypothetical protein
MASFRSFSTLLLASVAGLLPVASSTPLNVAATAPTTYGHWDLTYNSGSNSTGYRWESVNGSYSGPPAVPVTCNQLYDPTTKKTTKSCSDPTFGYSVGIIIGQNGKTPRFSLKLPVKTSLGIRG